MLDDPCVSAIDVEDWKAWFDLTETGSGHGRYTDTKYCLNAPRVMLTNEEDFGKEPEMSLSGVQPTDLWAMVRPTFGHLKEAHLLAVFKRCIALIGGRKAVYLRLPSEDPDAKIFAYTEGMVAQDWLKADNKEFLGKYRQGNHEKYGGFDGKVDEEMVWTAGLVQQRPLMPPAPPLFVETAGTQDETQREVDRVQAGRDGIYRIPPAPPTGTRATVRGRPFPIPDLSRASATPSWALPPVVADPVVAAAIADDDANATRQSAPADATPAIAGPASVE